MMTMSALLLLLLLLLLWLYLVLTTVSHPYWISCRPAPQHTNALSCVVYTHVYKICGTELTKVKCDFSV
jgi:hypothetical protein